jgi:hypothetical protein
MVKECRAVSSRIVWFRLNTGSGKYLLVKSAYGKGSEKRKIIRRGLGGIE